MMKDLLFHQQQQQVVLEENMSNLTSASGEASVSSGQYFAPPLPQPQLPPAKKKRNLPGNPDPDAEVIALSPKALLATNRFMCEICNKGFQRDQNLQLHRRGHNLPWKLKQRTNKEVRKKVYVCPEPGCVHHDPSRALGDLTGIKKHFCRKHGEKKWKCEKCSKRYAVQSDWKAHSKTCGTKEYRCDCGTLFSRRDSFITHRAFCDALAEESARANPILSTHQPGSSSSTQFNPQAFPVLKKEQQTNFNLLRPEIPPWLAPQPVLGPGPGPPPLDHLSSLSSASIFSTSRLDHHHQDQFNHHHDLSNPNPNLADPTLLSFHPSTVPSQPHMSATALLQKAAQMGATMSSNTASATALRPHQQAHVSAGSNNSTTTPAGFGLDFTSREVGGANFVHGLNTGGATSAAGGSHSLLQEMVKSLSSGTGLHGTSIADEIGGVFTNPKKLKDSYATETLSKAAATNSGRNNETRGGSSGEDLTRDFLGIRAFSHSDMLNIAGLGNCMNSSHEHNQKPWQG
ncbi:hypothetical protein SLA2020_290490 [Shorea laevis]